MSTVKKRIMDGLDGWMEQQHSDNH